MRKTKWECNLCGEDDKDFRPCILLIENDDMPPVLPKACPVEGSESDWKCE